MVSNGDAKAHTHTHMWATHQLMWNGIVKFLFYLFQPNSPARHMCRRNHWKCAPNLPAKCKRFIHSSISSLKKEDKKKFVKTEAFSTVFVLSPAELHKIWFTLISRQISLAEVECIFSNENTQHSTAHAPTIYTLCMNMCVCVCVLLVNAFKFIESHIWFHLWKCDEWRFHLT